jgi:basic membrane protein A
MRRTALLLLALICASAGTSALTTAATRRPLKVGFLEGTAGLRAAPGIQRDTYEGFVDAVKAFGLQGSVRQVGPRSTVIDAVAYFVRQRYDLVVVATDTLPPPIDRLMAPIVTRFPNTRFLLPDVTPELVPKSWKNVRAFGFRVEEAAYLAGYLGGLVEAQRPGRHVVSSVGGLPVPQLDPFIAGFQAGAHRADPRITALNDYSYDFVVPRKCRAVALAQIARGSGVVFDVAGACGIGALQAAKARHVWGIGVDVDESFLGPYILTSVLKHAGRALYLELSRFAQGRLFTTGFTWFGVRDQAVGLGKISPRVPKALVQKLTTIETEIARGQIHAPARIS